MSQEFHIEELEFAAAEKRMNELGGEGWLAVNCWPTDHGKMAMVMKREKTFVALHKRFIEPARPLKDLDLKAVLEICLREKYDKGKYSAKVSDVAGEFGTTVKGLVEHLQLLGFSTTKQKELHIDHFSLNLTNTKGTRYLNARPSREIQKESDSAPGEATLVPAAIPVPKRAGYKPAVEGKSLPATKWPASTPPTIRDLIEYCSNNPNNDPDYKPSRPLNGLVSHFHIPEAQIERIYEDAVKADPSLKKYVGFNTPKETGKRRWLQVAKGWSLPPN